MSPKLIYHITSATQWHDARQDYYCPTGFDRDRFLIQSLMGETPALDSSFKSGNPPNGLSRKTALYRFIHCSYGHQLLTVAHRFYRGEKCLVILVIESSKINGKLIEENLEGGTELYPHLYGVLPINAVSKAIAFPCNADGSFCLPEELTI